MSSHETGYLARFLLMKCGCHFGGRGRQMASWKRHLRLISKQRSCACQPKSAQTNNLQSWISKSQTTTTTRNLLHLIRVCSKIKVIWGCASDLQRNPSTKWASKRASEQARWWIEAARWFLAKYNKQWLVWPRLLTESQSNDKQLSDTCGHEHKSDLKRHVNLVRKASLVMQSIISLVCLLLLLLLVAIVAATN